MPDIFEVVGDGTAVRLGIAGVEGELGRDAACEIVLADPRVSRRHARVRVEGDALLIEDLGSTGGTFVNGGRIAQPTRLAPGDVVLVGDTELRVMPLPAAAPTVMAAAVEGPESPSAGRRRRVAVPLALFLGVSLAVFLLAQAQPFEHEAPAAPDAASVILGDAARGQALFAQTCSGCHGARAEGGVGPALAGNPIGVEQAVGVVRQGRGVMPAGLVSGQDESDVAGYLATILGAGSAPPPATAPLPPPSPPPAPTPPAVAPPAPTAPTADAARGSAIFATTCAGCHGPQAEGRVGPALAGNPIGVTGALAVIRQGRGVMPGGLVTGQDEQDLAAFLATVLAPRP